MANEKTPNYHWDIPNPYGLQIVEMIKVASTFGAIDSQFKAFADAFQAHEHSFQHITNRPNTLSGYGITDAMTSEQVRGEIQTSQDNQQSLIDQTIQSLANSTADALALRVRVDVAQAFTLAQKSRARQNIDALGTIDKGAPNGVASLDAAGKIPSSQLPPVAIKETFVVNSQASMLALVAERGDVAVRTDLKQSFILRLEPATVLANWQEILTPADGVLSVNGLTGPAVNLIPEHINLGNVANKSEQQMVESGPIADALLKAGGNPVGSVLQMASDHTIVPPGYLLMNGAPVTSTYPALRAYGIAAGWTLDGSGNPIIPDMGGYFARGWRPGQLVDAGRVFGSVQQDAIQELTGEFRASSNTGSTITGAPISGVFGHGATTSNYTTGSTAGSGDARAIRFDASNVARTADETRPANRTFTYWVKAYPAVVDTGLIDLANLTNDIQQVGASLSTISSEITNIMADITAVQNQFFGNGQTWQSVSRPANTVFQNTTGRTIFITVNISSGYGTFQMSPDNVNWSIASEIGGGSMWVMGMPIPNGYYYKTTTGGHYRELR